MTATTALMIQGIASSVAMIAMGVVAQFYKVQRDSAREQIDEILEEFKRREEDKASNAG